MAWVVASFVLRSNLGVLNFLPQRRKLIWFSLEAATRSDEVADTLRDMREQGRSVNRSRQRSRVPRNRAVYAPGRNRTCDLALRRRTLYPLSYRRETN